MRIGYKIALFLCILITNVYAQSYEVNLWKTDIPNRIENNKYTEIKTYKDSVLVRVSQVSIPTLTIFKPKNPNGTAILICPGGGYAHLSMDKEGYKVAAAFQKNGITAVVLKYRLPSDSIMLDKTIGPLQDAQEAMRYMRREAEKLYINSDKIGVIGFSAGGHLAATLSNYYDEKLTDSNENLSAKPNFSILIYPVISMENEITHLGSQKNLLGIHPKKESILKYSLDKNITTQTPITFMIHSADDASVTIENSLNYYYALHKNGIKVEMHLYDDGGHGFGQGNTKSNSNWFNTCITWMEMHNF
ncbi:Alpha/beta hydrolase [Flavobacterium sp. 9AF]|uniref:alpha/beta hydrolase n=1 Tax=Flavobacterium sp. 9AF TaxID=2653142 RepID=UPI0012F1ABCD|nr:alpha/beta hydrolase [Flavobacterium sp. 9AF]VXC03554.1 Alpha/beta hydrolase [Flavobacterium sp. 9AF]